MTKQISNGVNKTIIGLLAAVLAFGGIVWLARPDSTNNTASVTPVSNEAGGLTAEESSFDFGSISMAAGNVQHTFKIKNPGGQPLTIKKIYTSCMCTTALLAQNDRKFGPFGMPGHGPLPKINQVINPGEGAALEVVFDPAAHGPSGLGRIQRAVMIEDQNGPALELNFTALVTP